ncbi:hypothetical protein PF66_02275 [Pseudomonas asplenii]|uniref:Mu-like prophage FluMu N-terminal domain-containing protein n=1 Tax=Pseudomonas asplenii TaxID=53407 RepID=A0A0N0E4L1_9PSED|nr:HI1506-related protein [Pseudomonas fuscovaginae]KPA91392.1 hypothetical protein PF66_02275 [Pseudomonas fuscovaginae]
MGVVIKSKIDGFRRGGIAHSAEGTFYADGELTEQQLEQFRREPQLVVAEQAVPGATASQSNSSPVLMQEMGETIAELEHELEQTKAGLLTASFDLEKARAGLQSACSDLVKALDRQKAAPALIVEAAKLLAPADPAQEGVICILPDSLAGLVTEHLKALEAQDDEHKSTLDSSGGAEPSSSTPPVPAMAPASGDHSDAVTEKAAGKRGAASKKGAE